MWYLYTGLMLARKYVSADYVRFWWLCVRVFDILLCMATETESLKFTVDAKGFLASLKRMEDRLESLADKSESVATRLAASFKDVELSARGLGNAVNNATRNIGPAAQAMGRLAGALRTIERTTQRANIERTSAAFGLLNEQLKNSGSVVRFADKMVKLQAVLKTVRADAADAARSLGQLSRAADAGGVTRAPRATAVRSQPSDVQVQAKATREAAKEVERDARRLKRALREVAAANKEVGDSSSRAARQSVGAFKRIEGSVAGLRIRLLNLRTAFAFIGGGFLAKRVIGFAGDFEEALGRVNTIIRDQSEVQLPQYKEQLLALSQQGPQNLIDLTEGLYQIISSGIPTVEGAGGAFDVLAASQKAAVAGVSSLRQAADATVTVLNGFRRESLTANEATDKLFKTVELGRTRFDLLARSVGRVAAIADEFGASSDELLGGLAAITRVIPSTNEAVTQLRALITGIVRPTARATEVLNALTENRADLRDLLSAGGLQKRGLVETLRELRDVTGGSADAISKLFPNVRALAASAILGGRNFKQFQDLVAQVGDSAGSTDRAFNKLRFTFNNVAAVFRNKVATILVRIGDRIMPKLVDLFERLGAFLLKNQDKIVKFFETIADILIRLIEFLQKNANAVLGGLIGFLTSKGAKLLAGFFGQGEEEAYERGQSVGQQFKSGLISALTTGATIAIGSIIGSAAGGIETDVEGQLALDKAQPLVNEQLAREGGYKTADQFSSAFQQAIGGRALLADTATQIDDQFFTDVQKQLNLNGTVEGVKNVADAFNLLKTAIVDTGSDFANLRDQIDNALVSLDETTRLAAEETGGAGISDPRFVDDIRKYQEELAASAERLEATAPQLAAAVRELATNTQIESVDEFQKKLRALRDEAPAAAQGLLQLSARVAEFAEFLPGAQFGDQNFGISFDVNAITDVFDPAFNVLRQKQDEQKQLQDNLAKDFTARIEDQTALEIAAYEKVEQTKQRIAEIDNAIPAAAGQQERRLEAQRVLLEQELKKREEKIIALRKETAEIQKQAAAQERASFNLIKGIDEFIQKLVEANLLREKQIEVDGRLRKVQERQNALRFGEIRDNGLLLRIRRQIRDLNLQADQLAIERLKAEQQSLVAAAQAQLALAKTVGNVTELDRLEENLLNTRLEANQVIQGELAIGLAGLAQLREENQLLDSKEDLERTIANIRKQGAKASLDAQNAAAKGDANREKAAKQIAAAYFGLAREASELLGDGFSEATARVLDERFKTFIQSLDETLRARVAEDLQLRAAAAVRPSAIVEFENAVTRAKLAALESAQRIEQVMQGTAATARQLIDTQNQLALARRRQTLGGQFSQALNGGLDLQEFKAARAAIQNEIDAVGVTLNKALADLQATTDLRRQSLEASLKDARRRRNRAIGFGFDTDQLNEEIRKLTTDLELLGQEAAATSNKLKTEAIARLTELGLELEQLPAVTALVDAESAFAESTTALADGALYGAISLTSLGASIVDAFSGDAEAAVLGLTAVFEALVPAIETVTQKINQFLPDFGRLINDVFDALLKGANSVIDGLSTAFTGVFDILFGGFTSAIQSILGFDFFGDTNTPERQTLPSVDLRGRFFDQRPADRARVLEEIRAQGAARDALAAQQAGAGVENLSPQDLARQTLERAIETAVRATEVIVEILPELLTTFLDRVIELLPSLAGRLALAVAAGIRILADKFDEILVATLDAVGEALPVILEAIGEAIPVIVAQLVARLPEIVYQTLKALGYGAVGLGRGLLSSITSGFGIFHQGGMVKGTQRNRGLAAAMHSMGAQGFADGGMVTLGGLTQSMINRRLQKDEVPAVLQAGERVVSRDELARMGGEAALNQLIANGGLRGGESFDGIIQGMSPQAAAVMASAFAQALGQYMGGQQGYNPNLGARIGRGRGF